MRNVIVAYVSAVVLLAGFAIGAGVLVLRDSESSAAEDHTFSIVSWEIEHFPEKWLFKIGGFFGGPDRPEGEDSDILERYFNLTARIEAVTSTDPASDELPALEEERAWLENSVEDIIEGRMTAVLEDEGLALEPPIFSDLGLIFPPVDFEFDKPPHVLATSPRDLISLKSDDLLTPGIEPGEIEEIEAEAEANGDTSALIVPTGGVATYPTIVSDLRPYESLIELLFHEWTHQYLAFFPLGSSYFEGGDARTLNESVANLAGRELAAAYFDRYESLAPPDEPIPTPQPTTQPDPSFDFRSEMRTLRRAVDLLLELGHVEAAELLMNDKRDQFEERGVYIRKLNQAYFAFYGSYADTPASIDPIGPKLELLLENTGSPGEFLRTVSAITTRAELNELLGQTGP